MNAPAAGPRSPGAVFAEYCERGELAYQVTPDGRPVFYPRTHAPITGDTLDWRVSSGKGTVYATTVIRPRGEQARQLALVDLDEGFRMMSRVEGVAPEDVTVGMRVELGWAQRPEQAPLPIFTPAPDQA